MVRLFVLFALFMAGFFVWLVFDKSARFVSDFERVRINNYRSYLFESRRRSWIVIEADGKKYFLDSREELMPWWAEKISDILPVLSGSAEMTLWVDEYSAGYSVMGLEVGGKLIIPPTQGVKLHENERRFALWGAVFSFVSAVFFYFYIRKHDGLDWKLSRKNRWKYSKRTLRGGRHRAREKPAPM
jgi:hypothetical protein